MRKSILFLIIVLSFLSLIVFSQTTSTHQTSIDHLPNKNVLSDNALKNLESKGFKFISMHNPVVSPRMLDSTNLPETTHLKMSLDVRKAKNLQITWLGTPAPQKTATGQNDVILSEGFEGDFPGANWQLSGDPTWGKSNYQKHGGQNSVFCAKGGAAGVTPPANYPNNMNAMMVFGPFDLSNASLAFVRFWFWLETEIDKDWFWYMASLDGVNFSGIGVSGSTGTSSPTWEQTSLNLADVPDLGSLIGQSSVWIAFGFTSDSTGTKRGVFVDDVEVQKAAVGTGISGYLKGSLSPAGNPYIAFDHVGVAQGDSLLILPGCELRFDSGKEFVVEGLLDARGMESDSIKFSFNSLNPKTGDKWLGIGLYASTDCSCQIEYSHIGYAGCGIYIRSRKAEIKNCLVSYNGTGIHCVDDVNPGSTIRHNQITKNDRGVEGDGSHAVIIENYIADNYYCGIYADFSDFFIQGNIISDNRSDGVLCLTLSEPIIVNNVIKKNGRHGIWADSHPFYGIFKLTAIDNLIINNNGSGIKFSGSAAEGDIVRNIVKGNKLNGIDVTDVQLFNPNIKLLNNTIIQNDDYGVYYGNNTIFYSKLFNNIIAGHAKGGVQFKASQSFYIWYNNFYDNNPNIDTYTPDSLGYLTRINMNGDPCDPYFNIMMDPLFMDVSSNDFSLRQNSPCKNAGNPSVFYNDIDGTPNDMGAHGGNALYLHPTNYDFGDVVINFTRSDLFEITNYRDVNFTINSLQLSDHSNFSVSPNAPMVIFPYSSITIMVNFIPHSTGNFSSLLTISSNDFYGTTSAQILCTGRGINGTVINTSTVSGIWSLTDSPYIVTRSITVPKGSSLIIQPGVQVLFENGSFKIEGLLNAVGSERDSIIFTRSHPSKSWDGLCFDYADSASRLEFCRIEYSNQAGIYLNKSNIVIKHNRIQHNRGNYDAFVLYGGGGITCNNSSPAIANNMIKNNRTTKSGGGILTESWYGKSSPLIENNFICNNWADKEGGGIWLKDSTIIINNIIMSNRSQCGGGGLCYNFYYSKPPLLLNNVIIGNIASSGGGISGKVIANNNTIVNNEAENRAGGAYLYQGSIINNSIIYSNKAKQDPQISGDSEIIYSDIQGGRQGLGNINADPQFVDTANSNYRLQPNSPCIDAGDPDSIYNDPEDPNNPGYALYPAMGTIRNDMGAYGGPGAASFPVNRAPMAFNLLSPNDQDTIFTIHPLINWQAAIDPNLGDVVSYTLFYDTDSSFASAAIVSGISTTSVQLHHLKDHQNYFWKVKAEDSHGASTFSKQVFQFYTFAAPLPLKLLSPASDDTVTTDTLSFSWQKAYDPNPADTIRYSFLCDSSRSFIKPIMVTGISDTSFTFTDSLNNNTHYFWTVLAVDKDSFTTASSDTFSFLLRYRPTGMAGSEGSELPTEFALSQNYPNPFNAQTIIKYQLPKDSHVTLKIFNLLGQNVATVVDKDQQAGYYSVSWDAGKMASGIYFYYLNAEGIAPDKSGSGFSKVSKMILLQ